MCDQGLTKESEAGTVKLVFLHPDAASVVFLHHTTQDKTSSVLRLLLIFVPDAPRLLSRAIIGLKSWRMIPDDETESAAEEAG